MKHSYDVMMMQVSKTIGGTVDALPSYFFLKSESM